MSNEDPDKFLRDPNAYEKVARWLGQYPPEGGLPKQSGAKPHVKQEFPEGGIAAILAIILAVFNLNSLVRIVLVALAIALTVYVAWRFPAPLWQRVLGAIAATIVLVTLSAGPIQTEHAREMALDALNNFQIGSPPKEPNLQPIPMAPTK